jgi:hypothetical protein
MITGGQPRVGDDDAREPIGMFGGDSKPDQSAPILTDERDFAQV